MITAKSLRNVVILARGAGFIGYTQDGNVNPQALAEVAADLAAIAAYVDILAAQEAEAAKKEATE